MMNHGNEGTAHGNPPSDAREGAPRRAHPAARTLGILRRRIDAQGKAGRISLRMTIAMAAIAVTGGVLLTLGVLLGSRHEFSERGLSPTQTDVTAQLGEGMVVIDVSKALAFTLAFVIGVVIAVALVGWHYSRREVAPLERALALQRNFVADASHELKTPLAVIATRIDLIAFRRAHGGDIDQPLLALRGDVDRMNAIVTDLLVAARGAANAKPVALAGVIDQSVDAVRPLAEKKHVDIAVRIDGDRGHFVANGNETGLSRCLVAVLDNAIAHAPEKTEVTVSLGYGHHNDAAIRVTDHGPGIGKDPERLFRRFARDDDGTAHQGYGLGLALARDVASRYGGTLYVESTSSSPGTAGTVMRLELPLVDDVAGDE